LPFLVFLYPFGSQATGGNPPALGFAPRPYGRFAFVEDEEAAGLICVTSRLVEKYVKKVSG